MMEGPGGSAKLLKTGDLNCMPGCGLEQSEGGREGRGRAKLERKGAQIVKNLGVQAGSGALFGRKAKGLLIGVCWGVSSLLPGG